MEKGLIQKKNRGSQTPGKSKNETCKADYIKKFMAKRSHSYKDPEYADWCHRMYVANGANKATARK